MGVFKKYFFLSNPAVRLRDKLDPPDLCVPFHSVAVAVELGASVIK
jgi:hypothetical protein